MGGATLKATAGPKTKVRDGIIHVPTEFNGLFEIYYFFQSLDKAAKQAPKQGPKQGPKEAPRQAPKQALGVGMAEAFGKEVDQAKKVSAIMKGVNVPQAETFSN